ncbi:hypothetical protein C8J56DRAFT_1173436 [Mycena floridula]|nr:hypothetical protein C8J56DRAFT_1173436 [Mycena floridula]
MTDFAVLKKNGKAGKPPILFPTSMTKPPSGDGWHGIFRSICLDSRPVVLCTAAFLLDLSRLHKFTNQSWLGLVLHAQTMIHRKIAILLLLLGAPLFLASAQSFTSPSSWREPDVVTAPADRVSLAKAAIDESVSRINTTTAQYDGTAFGTTGLVFSQMAEFDLVTNQSTYKDQLKGFFKTVDGTKPSFADELLNYGLIYGYAATRAYVAYKDIDFLTWAQESWEFGRYFTLSAADLTSGKSGSKSFNLQTQCSGITMAGGAFYSTDDDNASLNALATGYFLINSALLADATSNSTYLDAAQASADFIHAHLFNVQSIVQDSISARQSDSCSVSSGTGPYNQGLMIEGLAVLASLTKDSDTQNLLYQTIAAAVNNSAWQGDDGVISFGSGKSGEPNLARGMIAAYNRNSTNANLRGYLKDYIGVQYNAVIDQATAGNNIYGASWVGPPGTTYSADAQSVSISVLLGGISLKNDTTTPDTTNSETDSSRPNLAGPIAGGVVGGLALITLVALFCFIRRRKRLSPERERKPDTILAAFIPEPFVMPESSSTMSPTTISNSVSLPTSTNPRYTEKQRHRWMPSSASAGQSSFAATESQAGDTRPTNPGTSVASPEARELPTEELVRLLNERLQDGPEWDVQEAPPEYHNPGRPDPPM